MRRRFASWLLEIAEWIYLRLYGWRRDNIEEWTAPAGYPKRHCGVPKGKAVNSQKWHAADEARMRRLEKRRIEQRRG